MNRLEWGITWLCFSPNRVSGQRELGIDMGASISQQTFQFKPKSISRIITQVQKTFKHNDKYFPTHNF
jgi:hypothetical protein